MMNAPAPAPAPAPSGAPAPTGGEITFRPGPMDGDRSADPRMAQYAYLQVQAHYDGESEHAYDAIVGYVRPRTAALVKAAPALLALARQYASECARCHGSGLCTITTHPGGIEVDADDQPCPDCAEIRAVIAAAEGKR